MALSRRLLVLALAGAAGLAIGAWTAVRWARSPERVVAAFHKLYHQKGDQTYQNTYWMGLHVQKNPFDLWTFQEILSETRPDVIVECGTFKGGSAYYFATLFDLMNHGRIITIDIEDRPERRSHPRITFLHGSSTAPEIVEKVKRLIAPGEKVMVTLDSDHSRAHVANELSIYSPIVSSGQYLIVEDTHFNGHPILPRWGPGPMEALDEFLPSHPEFVPDSSREKFLMTFNPKGYLKRK